MTDRERIAEAVRLKNLKLHDTMTTGSWTITRVNGGWLYDKNGMAVFVPRSNEFTAGLSQYEQ